MKLFDNELRLVILDVDGVILDHRAAIPAIMKKTAQDLGLPHTHIDGYFLLKKVAKTTSRGAVKLFNSP